MTDCNGLVWGVISIGGDNLSGEAPFEIKDSLSIYEAARVVSGRHPAPGFLEGADMTAYWRLLAAGSNRQNWRRVRPQRSVAMFHALVAAIEQDEITPVRLVYLTPPDPRAKGAIDCRFTRVKTIDVARLCMKKGWRPKAMRLRTKELEKELADGEAQDDVDAACREWLAGLPEHPRLTKEQALERFNRLRRKAKRKIIGERPFLRAWKESVPVSWHARGRLPGT